MKFTVLQPFQHLTSKGHVFFEEGNVHDPEHQGIRAEELDVFHRQGWVHLDDREDVAFDPSKTQSIRVNDRG